MGTNFLLFDVFLLFFHCKLAYHLVILFCEIIPIHKIMHVSPHCCVCYMWNIVVHITKIVGCGNTGTYWYFCPSAMYIELIVM